MARGKKSKRREQPEMELNMSSMIDVVFLLLIYFVFTQKPIVDDVHLSCDLPSPNPSPPAKIETPPPKIDVWESDVDDEFLYNGLKRTTEELSRELDRMGPDQGIIINCDPNAYHRKLILLLDLFQQKGMTNLNIIDATNDFKY